MGNTKLAIVTALLLCGFALAATAQQSSDQLIGTASTQLPEQCGQAKEHTMPSMADMDMSGMTKRTRPT